MTPSGSTPQDTVQPAVEALLEVAPILHDELSQPELDAAVAALDQLTLPVTAADVRALMSVLPANGDTAHGLNWTVLHAIEAADAWPLWELIEDPDHEWADIFRTRLANGGYRPPAS